MALPYGFVRAKLASGPVMKASHRRHETQYHLHIGLLVDGAPWDVAINVGTDDSDDLLKYKLVFDFRHPVIKTLGSAASAATTLTGTDQLPALDYVRSDLLANPATGGTAT